MQCSKASRSTTVRNRDNARRSRNVCWRWIVCAVSVAFLPRTFFFLSAIRNYFLVEKYIFWWIIGFFLVNNFIFVELIIFCCDHFFWLKKNSASSISLSGVINGKVDSPILFLFERDHLLVPPILLLQPTTTPLPPTFCNFYNEMNYHFCVLPDVEAPVIVNGCPADQQLFSGPLESPVNVSWGDPVITDNSGEEVTLTSDPAKGSMLEVGSHTVGVKATDASGNNASCVFFVSVQGG